MEIEGYHSQPALGASGWLVFVSEGDLWRVRLPPMMTQAPAADSNIDITALIPQRLTLDGHCSWPRLSPDESCVAYTSYVTGNAELHVVSLRGGPSQQLTRMGADGVRPLAWTRSAPATAADQGGGPAAASTALYFASNSSAPVQDMRELHVLEMGCSVEPQPSARTRALPQPLASPRKILDGHIDTLSVAPDNSCVLVARHTSDPLLQHWKGYAGGAQAQMFVSRTLDGPFVPLAVPEGLLTVSSPALASGSRLVFLAAAANHPSPQLYQARFALPATDPSSSLPPTSPPPPPHPLALDDLHPLLVPAADPALPASSFALRNAAFNPSCTAAVFQAGGQLFHAALPPSAPSAPVPPAHLPLDWAGPQVGRRPRVAGGLNHIDSFEAHPSGHSLALLARGRMFELALWEGPVLELPPPAPGTVLAFTYLYDSRLLLAIEPADIAEPIHLLQHSPAIPAAEQASEPLRLRFVPLHPELPTPATLGRPAELAASPTAPVFAATNERLELIVGSLSTGLAAVVDRADNEGGLRDLCFSADGRYLAYVKVLSKTTSQIILYGPIPDLSAATAAASRPHRLPVTSGAFRDSSPSFDPDGRFLYFISSRRYEPVADQLLFGFHFPQAQQPFLLVLSADTGSPFHRPPRAPGTESDSESEEGEEEEEEEEEEMEEEGKREEEEGEGGRGRRGNKGKGGPAGRAPKGRPATRKKSEGADGGGGNSDSDESDSEDDVPQVRVDEEGITERIAAFPVPTGRYEQIIGLDKDRVMYTRYPIAHEPRDDDGGGGGGGEADEDEQERAAIKDGKLFVYSFRWLREKSLFDGPGTVSLSQDGQTMVFFDAEEDLYAFPAGEPPNDDDEYEGDPDAPGPLSGRVDLQRLELRLDPSEEWPRLFASAWRLAHEQFLRADMNQCDWPALFQRYQPLVARVGSRGELNDVINEMFAELGTSHTYVGGGDYTGSQQEMQVHAQGLLGAATAWDAERRQYRVLHVVRGDEWDAGGASGPLARLGSRVRPGDFIASINRQAPHPGRGGLGALLANAGGKEVLVGVQREVVEGGRKAGGNGGRRAKGKGKGKGKGEAKNDAEPEMLRVRAALFPTVARARYRDWVSANASYCHRHSDSRVGYIHVPDMEMGGFADFHRVFPREARLAGLVVDVRWNSGGFVSELLLARLAVRPIGHMQPRFGQREVLPEQAAPRVLVLLVDENTGSDGEIFAQAFRQLGLGAVVGRRTWGGVLGCTNLELADGGTVVVACEAFVPGEGPILENVGVAPDEEVLQVPQVVRQSGPNPEGDRQLNVAIAKAVEALQKSGRV